MKQLNILIALLFSSALMAQSNDAVTLKWKLKPNEVLTYKTALDEIDTANFKSTTFNFGSFIKTLKDSSSDKKVDEMVKEFNKEFKNTTMISMLTERKKGIIDIALRLDKKEPDADSTRDSVTIMAAKEMLKYFQSLSKGVALRGAVNENGTVQSFYLKNDQRNLIALFYELPDKPIKTGDSWSLDIHFLSMDQNFVCDTSSRKNQVKLIGIKKEGTETIAVMKYDIEEYVAGDDSSPMSDKSVKTMMKMTYNGIAEFSVDEGRWKSYNGIMSLTSSGIMDSHTTKRVSLIAK
jgi:hypothetical protein